MSFTIEFNELCDELVERKINEYITHTYHNNNYDRENTLNELLEDERAREWALNNIRLLFPITL